jgi:uncharacterized membrane protein YheB (UPF0754 family)
MDYLLRILILATIGGLIGYITNVVAIKLIFRPIVAYKLPILNIEVLGLIPKRRADIAKNIGEIVQNEFLSMDEILSNVINDEDKNNISQYIKIRVKMLLNEKMSFIPTPIKSIVHGYIEDIIDEEIKSSIDDLSSDLINKATTRINIQEMVESKINELDLYELENIILKVAKEELKHIEQLGLILGFGIGIIQGIITIFI